MFGMTYKSRTLSSGGENTLAEFLSVLTELAFILKKQKNKTKFKINKNKGKQNSENNNKTKHKLFHSCYCWFKGCIECQKKVDISFKINLKWFKVHILPLKAKYIFKKVGFCHLKTINTYVLFLSPLTSLTLTSHISPPAASFTADRAARSRPRNLFLIHCNRLNFGMSVANQSLVPYENMCLAQPCEMTLREPEAHAISQPPEVPKFYQQDRSQSAVGSATFLIACPAAPMSL